MWSLLRNVSTADAYRQAGAWQHTYEAAQSLAGRLQGHREGLATRWSPENSEAARAYLGRLDELIGSAQQLADVAVSNRQALVTLANAVDVARPKMQRVYEQSQAVLQAGAPRADGSGALAQQRLHEEATQIMGSLGEAAMDSWRHYTLADDYQPPPPTESRSTVQAVSAGSSPPLTTSGRPARSIATSDIAGGPSAIDYEHFVQSDPAAPMLAGLARVAPAATDSAPAAVSEPDARPTGVLPSPIPEDSVGTLAPALPGGRVEGIAAEPKSIVGRRPISAGDVIGGMQNGVLSERSLERGAVANPVGGMIGGRDVGTGMLGGVPKIGSRSEVSRRRLYDLDDRWPLQEGVPPILMPGPEPTDFDPGPGVIGIDR
jgi:hypothetical protein